MRQPELSSRRSYPVAWTIVIRCFTACLTATSGKFSLSRMPPLDFLLELGGGNTSRRCCASCTGFQSRVELTSNWHVLSSRLCLVMHLRTCLTTYIWSRKGLDVTCDRSCVVPGTYNTFGDRSFAVAGGLVSVIAFQDTYATRISPTAASGVNSRHIGFLATGAQCDILCVINIRTNNLWILPMRLM